jgi:DNA-binding NarL/FixJ family response regulator
VGAGLQTWIFRLIDQAVKTAEIADRLHLSVKTVETYRDRIRQKLDLSDGTARSWSIHRSVSGTMAPF